MLCEAITVFVAGLRGHPVSLAKIQASLCAGKELKMKNLACLMISLCLVAGILLVAVADVNHGHGPGYHDDENGAAEDSH